MNDIHRYSPARRYASPLERPAPRSMLATPAFWICALGCLVVWVTVISAVVAYWSAP